MIKVNDRAKEKIHSLLSDEGKASESFVRVGVKGGGCSGLMYDLDFDSELKEDDKVIEDNNIKIVIDKKSMLYLAGTELDYTDSLNDKGYSIIQPKDSQPYGYGKRF